MQEHEKGAKLSLNSIGSLFAETWKTYKEQSSVLIEILLVPILIIILGNILVYLGSLFALVGMLAIFVGYIVLGLASLSVVFSIHNKTGVDASYKAMVPLFWPYIWVFILMILAVIGGYFMLVIPGIWMMTAFSLVLYPFVIEERRGLDALRQSKEYVQGYWWGVFGRVLLLGILYCIVVCAIEVPIFLIGAKIIFTIVSLTISLFFIPFSSIYNYVIFQNLRELKPHLATTEKKEGKGFIKAAAIVGFVAPIILSALLVILAGVGIISSMHSMQYENNDTNAGGYYNTP